MGEQRRKMPGAFRAHPPGRCARTAGRGKRADSWW